MATAQPGIPQMIGADIPGKDSQPGEMCLRTSRAGAAIDQQERLDVQIEDIHRDLQDAHAGVDPDDRANLDRRASQLLDQGIGKTRIAWLGEDVLGTGMGQRLKFTP